MTDAPQQDLLRQFLDALREGSIPFNTSVLATSPIALRSGESLAFVCYEVALKEPHVVDRGDLVLTAQRYVFLGQKRTIAVDLSEILAVALRPAEFRIGALQADPLIVKIRQAISVRASVENVGDVAGTFPGSMEANGQAVVAQPTEIAPGQSTTLAFTVSQDSAGACRLQLGDARKTVMVVRPLRPANGHMLRRSKGGGSPRLSIKNRNAVDAMVILTRTNAPSKPVLAVYVRQGSKATVGNVPDGRYIVWDCLGQDWNSYMRDFLTTEEQARWRDPLVFSTSSSTNYWTTYSSDARYVYSQRHSQTHTDWTNWTLTLGSGPSKYVTMTSAPRFPKL